MKKALIHKNGVVELVDAKQVFDGMYDKKSDFVDPEYEFRVTFVSSAKGHGGPYFRLYWSLEDYNKFSKEKKERYDILSGMKHFAESPWHRYWEEKVSNFAKKEQYIKDYQTKKYKRADALYEKEKLCIEFQHSYIANDFQERNEFYSKLGYKVIWLYDLTMHDGKQEKDGFIQVLEDNARGFFRIAGEENDLTKTPVFIQLKDNRIYKVEKLYRKEISGEKKSTVRYFLSSLIYSEDEFVDVIKNRTNELFEKTPEYDTINKLWKKHYTKMIIEKKGSNDQIIVYGKNGEMNIDYDTGCITYQYCKYIPSSGKHFIKSKKFYKLSYSDEGNQLWKLVKYE